jgi:hypothetical protein
MLLAPKTNGKGKDVVVDIFDTYVEALDLHWMDMLGYALAAIAVALLWSVIVGRRRAAEPWAGERWLRLGLVLVLIGVGLWRAYTNATCFDDAYISLRYAENFVAGHGLVYNEGEYVEGYTNFLWTILVSLFMWLTPVEAPLIAVLGSMAAFALNLWVVWRIGLKIAPPFHRHAFAVPIAVGLLAVQNIFTDYGTTGLETAFASLMVNLGVLALVSGDNAKASFWAGFWWIMATLTRPDHAVFYAVGSIVVFGVWIGPTWHARKSGLRTIWREGLRPMATYAAPFAIWLLYSAWKLHYYGELLPNTYYAKSAYMTYYEQGVAYAAAFHLSSHLWIVVALLVLLWPWRAPSNIPGRRFMAFAIPAILLYEWYVVRVGGDFMEGRFYVTLIPLLLLAGEQLVHEFSLTRAARKLALEQLRAARAARVERLKSLGVPPTSAAEAPPAEPAPAKHRAPLAVGAILLVGCMAASAIGIRLIGPRQSLWHLTDETTYYPIVRWSPIVIDHANYRVGVILEDIHDGLVSQGVEQQPILATGAIGLLGYYSKMPLVDRLGLTDATVAHREITKRGRPGHEKWATAKYLTERGVHFRRGGGYASWFKTNATIRWGPSTGGRRWFILWYDRELMNAIRAAYPDVWFSDFEIYIDKYIARLPHTNYKKARKEYGLFKRYYFNHNEDPERLEAFKRYFAWVKAGNKPAALLEDGGWDVYKQRGVVAGKQEQELRRARAARTREAAKWALPWNQLALRRKYGLLPAPVPKPVDKRKSADKRRHVPEPNETDEGDDDGGGDDDDDDDGGDER